MPTANNEKLAVLIDADNAQASVIYELLAEVSRYGTASVKRAYGDWTTPNLQSWKQVLLKLAIQPIQQFSYTTGKNSTDSSLIIDAMDLLHAGNLDGFCLVSSDSDFTRLATRIREAGLTVYGFGQKKTPPAFVAVCDKFVFTEILNLEPISTACPESDTERVPAAREEPTPAPLKSILSAAITATAQDDGWAMLPRVHNFILQMNPSFDLRKYGCKKLGELVRKQSYLDVKEVPTSAGSKSVKIYVRRKSGAASVKT